MGTFKRHIDPEYGVHKKHMFDYDQISSCLKGKSVSIDVSVNSLSNEKVLKNGITLAVIDAIKLCGQLGIALQGHRDHPDIWHAPTSAGVGNFVHINNYAVRNGSKELENHLKTCSKRKTYLWVTTRNKLLKCYQIVAEGLLTEVKASKIITLILEEASEISHKLSFCLRFVDSNNDIREEFHKFIYYDEGVTDR